MLTGQYYEEHGYGALSIKDSSANGQAQAASFALAQARIPGGGYTFALWQPWSSNDGTGGMQSDYDTYVAAFITLCQAHSCIPIIITHIPWVALDATNDAIRLSINTQVRGLAGPGVLIVDMDSVMTNNATPARIPAPLTQDGGTHPSYAGQVVMAPLLVTAIRTALGF